MANILFSTKVPCEACFSMDQNVYSYSIRNETFAKAVQMNKLTLCYICRFLAIRTDAFIDNISSIQTLLKSYTVDKNIATSDATENVNIKNVLKLDKSNMQQIIVENGINNDNSMLDKFFIISDHKQIEDVKSELFIFDNNYDLKDEYDDCDVNSPLHVKNECASNLGTEEEISEMKIPLKIEHTQMDIEKSAFEKKGKKKKVKKDTEPGSHYRQIYLSNEQCIEDRLKMSTDKRYTNSPYKCEDCLKGYTHRDSYEKHMVSHEEESGSHVCDVCKQRRKTSELLTRHRALHFRKYKCMQCYYTKLTRISIEEHYNAVHSAKVIYSCNMCFKTYWKKTLLRKHIAYHHSDTERVNCQFCDKTYANNYVLKTHLNTIHADKTCAPPAKKEHVCCTCGAAFKNASQLRAHGHKHSDARLCYCVECDKSFKSESILKQHLRFAAPHVNQDFLPYACTDAGCEKKFASARSRAAHHERVHLQRRLHRCSDCDKAYFSSWVLAGHRKSAHGNQERVKKFPCTMCDKVFHRKFVLKDHIRTHTGERPYQCKHCPSAFTQSSVLWRHVKTIHMKPKVPKGVE